MENILSCLYGGKGKVFLVRFMYKVVKLTFFLVFFFFGVILVGGDVI